MKLFYLCGLLTIVILNMVCQLDGKFLSKPFRLRSARSIIVGVKSNIVTTEKPIMVSMLDRLKSLTSTVTVQPIKKTITQTIEEIKQQNGLEDSWNNLKSEIKTYKSDLKNAENDEVLKEIENSVIDMGKEQISSLKSTEKSLKDKLLKSNTDDDKQRILEAIEHNKFMICYISMIMGQTNIQSLENERAKEIDNYNDLSSELTSLKAEYENASNNRKLQLKPIIDKLDSRLYEKSSQIIKIDNRLDHLYKIALKNAVKGLEDIDNILSDKNFELKLCKGENSELQSLISLLNDKRLKLLTTYLELIEKYAHFKQEQLVPLEEKRDLLEKKQKCLIYDLETAKGDQKVKLTTVYNNYQIELRNVQANIEKVRLEAKDAKKNTLRLKIEVLEDRNTDLRTQLKVASKTRKPKIEAEIERNTATLVILRNELAKYNDSKPDTLEEEKTRVVKQIIILIGKIKTAKTDDEKNQLYAELKKYEDMLKILNKQQTESQTQPSTTKPNETIEDLKKLIAELTIRLKTASIKERPQIEDALKKAQEKLKDKQKLPECEIDKNALNKAKVFLVDLEELIHKMNCELKNKTVNPDNEFDVKFQHIISELLNCKNILIDRIAKYKNHQVEPLNDFILSLEKEIENLLREWKKVSDNKKEQLEEAAKQTEANLILMNANLDKKKVDLEEANYNAIQKEVDNLKEKERKLKVDLETAKGSQKKNINIELRRIRSALNDKEGELESQKIKLKEVTNTALESTNLKLEKIQGMQNDTIEQLKKRGHNLDPKTKEAKEKTKSILADVYAQLEIISKELTAINDKVQKSKLDILLEKKIATEKKLAQLNAEYKTSTGVRRAELDEELKQAKANLESLNAAIRTWKILLLELQHIYLIDNIAYNTDIEKQLEAQLKTCPSNERPQLEDKLKQVRNDLAKNKSKITKLENDLLKQIEDATSDMEIDLNNQKQLLKETTNKLKKDGPKLDPKIVVSLEKTKNVLLSTIAQITGYINDLNDVNDRIRKVRPENLLEQKQILEAKIKQTNEQLKSATDENKDKLTCKLNQYEIELKSVLVAIDELRLNSLETQKEDLEDDIYDLETKVVKLKDDLEKCSPNEKPEKENILLDAKNELSAKQNDLAKINNEYRKLALAVVKSIEIHLSELDDMVNNADDDLNCNLQDKAKKTISKLQTTKSVLTKKADILKPENIILADIKKYELRLKQLKVLLQNSTGKIKEKIENEINDIENTLDILETKLIMAKLESEEENRNDIIQLIKDLNKKIQELQDKLKKSPTKEEKSKIEKALRKAQQELKEKEAILSDIETQLKRNRKAALDNTEEKLDKHISKIKIIINKLADGGKDLDPKEKEKLEKSKITLLKTIYVLDKYVVDLKDKVGTNEPETIENLEKEQKMLENRNNLWIMLLKTAIGDEKMQLNDKVKRDQKKLNEVKIKIYKLKILDTEEKQKNLNNDISDLNKKLADRNKDLKTASPKDIPNIKKDIEEINIELKKKQDELAHTKSELLKARRLYLDYVNNKLSEQIHRFIELSSKPTKDPNDIAELNNLLASIESLYELKIMLEDIIGETKPEDVVSLKKALIYLDDNISYWKLLLNTVTGKDKSKIEEKLKRANDERNLLNIYLQRLNIDEDEEKLENLEKIIKNLKNTLANLEMKLKTASPNDVPDIKKDIEKINNELKKRQDESNYLEYQLKERKRKLLNDATAELNERITKFITIINDENGTKDPEEIKKLYTIIQNLYDHVAYLKENTEKTKPETVDSLEQDIKSKDKQIIVWKYILKVLPEKDKTDVEEKLKRDNLERSLLIIKQQKLKIDEKVEKRNAVENVVKDLKKTIEDLKKKLETDPDCDKSDIKKTIDKNISALKQKENELQELNSDLKKNIEETLDKIKTLWNELVANIKIINNKLVKGVKDPKEKIALENSKQLLWQLILELEDLERDLNVKLSTTKPENLETLQQAKKSLENKKIVLIDLLQESIGEDRKNVEKILKRVDDDICQLVIKLQMLKLESELKKRNAAEKDYKDAMNKVANLEKKLKAASYKQKPDIKKDLNKAILEMQQKEDDLEKLDIEIIRMAKELSNDSERRLNQLRNQLKGTDNKLDKEILKKNSAELEIIISRLTEVFANLKPDNQFVLVEDKNALNEKIANIKIKLQNATEDEKKNLKYELEKAKVALEILKIKMDESKVENQISKRKSLDDEIKALEKKEKELEILLKKSPSDKKPEIEDALKQLRIDLETKKNELTTLDVILDKTSTSALDNAKVSLNKGYVYLKLLAEKAKEGNNDDIKKIITALLEKEDTILTSTSNLADYVAKVKNDKVITLEKDNINLSDKLKQLNIELNNADGDKKNQLKEAKKQIEAQLIGSKNLLAILQLEADKAKKDAAEKAANVLKSRIAKLTANLETATAEEKPKILKDLEKTKSDLAKVKTDISNLNDKLKRDAQNALTNVISDLDIINVKLNEAIDEIFENCCELSEDSKKAIRKTIDVYLDTKDKLQEIFIELIYANKFLVGPNLDGVLTVSKNPIGKKMKSSLKDILYHIEHLSGDSNIKQQGENSKDKLILDLLKILADESEASDSDSDSDTVDTTVIIQSDGTVLNDEQLKELVSKLPSNTKVITSNSPIDEESSPDKGKMSITVKSKDPAKYDKVIAILQEELPKLTKNAKVSKSEEVVSGGNVLTEDGKNLNVATVTIKKNGEVLDEKVLKEMISKFPKNTKVEILEGESLSGKGKMSISVKANEGPDYDKIVEVLNDMISNLSPDVEHSVTETKSGSASIPTVTIKKNGEVLDENALNEMISKFPKNTKVEILEGESLPGKGKMSISVKANEGPDYDKIVEVLNDMKSKLSPVVNHSITETKSETASVPTVTIKKNGEVLDEKVLKEMISKFPKNTKVEILEGESLPGKGKMSISVKASEGPDYDKIVEVLNDMISKLSPDVEHSVTETKSGSASIPTVTIKKNGEVLDENALNEMISKFPKNTKVEILEGESLPGKGKMSISVKANKGPDYDKIVEVLNDMKSKLSPVVKHSITETKSESASASVPTVIIKKNGEVLDEKVLKEMISKFPKNTKLEILEGESLSGKGKMSISVKANEGPDYDKIVEVLNDMISKLSPDVIHSIKESKSESASVPVKN